MNDDFLVMHCLVCCVDWLLIYLFALSMMGFGCVCNNLVDYLRDVSFDSCVAGVYWFIVRSHSALIVLALGANCFCRFLCLFAYSLCVLIGVQYRNLL